MGDWQNTGINLKSPTLSLNPPGLKKSTSQFMRKDHPDEKLGERWSEKWSERWSDELQKTAYTAMHEGVSDGVNEGVKHDQ